MNTIENLRVIIQNVGSLRNSIDDAHTKIQKELKPIIEIIQNYYRPDYVLPELVYFTTDDIVHFKVFEQSKCLLVGSYKFPLDAFKDAETFSQYARELEEDKKRQEEKLVEDAQRKTYEELKRKFEGNNK